MIATHLQSCQIRLRFRKTGSFKDGHYERLHKGERKGKAQQGEAVELEELQVDAQQQGGNREMMREMKPEPLQSPQLVAYGGDSTGNAQVHIFFARTFASSTTGIFLPSYHESLRQHDGRC
jgi:hypothetical protein